MLLNTTLERELYSFTEAIHDRFNQLYYGLSACEGSYDKDRVAEGRLKIQLLNTCLVDDDFTANTATPSLNIVPFHMLPPVRTGPSTIINIINNYTTPAVFEYKQLTPVLQWIIKHNLGYNPNVTTVNELKQQVEGQVTYIDNKNIIIDFSVPTAGTAYLS